ncbi:MAG: toll/interleukin-1 receptor domain-containing protein [Anaerolineales bacterium]|nr:toll/interleukin-1 receptor domain-containing protein [Anaerolineales bacterium]MBX3037590.1 toll/interleukin-1 receptor domain-containing protein [Anaerolineales bacterium]
MSTEEKNSQSELNAREFEHWQKLYYDEVYSFFAQNNNNRGEVAFESWETRFLSFLEENYPQKFEAYKKQTSGRIKSIYNGSLSFESFKDWKGNVVEPFIEQCIQDSRKGYIERHNFPLSIPTSKTQTIQEDKLKIFISHSSRDSELVSLIVDLIHFSLNLSSKEIRCTSLDGYGLSAGEDVDNKLREEVLNAEILIGLISKESFESAYVLFELGARWGQGTKLIPLLSHETTPFDLQGPIKQYHALSCKEEAQLYQLINDIAQTLSIKPEPPNSYTNKIKLIVKYKSNKATLSN